jgi:hypothetical protein
VLADLVQRSALRGRYAEVVDRESAYERLAARLRTAPAADEPDVAVPPRRRSRPRPRSPQQRQSTVEKVLGSSEFRQMARSAAAVVGREIARSIFGTRRR